MNPLNPFVLAGLILAAVGLIQIAKEEDETPAPAPKLIAGKDGKDGKDGKPGAAGKDGKTVKIAPASDG